MRVKYEIACTPLLDIGHETSSFPIITIPYAAGKSRENAISRDLREILRAGNLA